MIRRKYFSIIALIIEDSEFCDKQTESENENRLKERVVQMGFINNTTEIPDVAPWEDIPAKDPQATNIDSASEMTDDEVVSPEKNQLIDEIAMEYVGFWNRLVSQTNWEKGKVIHTWRMRLMDAGLPRNIYSDDTIAKRIGNVSGQHVGRLRRVYEQFNEQERLPGLYWSHYQAALDWEDAARWLQKASEEGLSVASMRIARWEEYGAPADRRPKESEIVSAEPDEDVNPFNDSNVDYMNTGDPESSEGKGGRSRKKAKPDSEYDTIHDTGRGGQTGVRDEAEMDEVDPSGSVRSSVWKKFGTNTGDVLNTINQMGPLPDDLADAFELLKVAILSHKLTKWAEVKPELILSCLGAMQAVVLSDDK